MTAGLYMANELNDGFSEHANLINVLGMEQIEYWSHQLDCTADELLNAVKVVGFNLGDLDQYLNHLQ